MIEKFLIRSIGARIVTRCEVRPPSTVDGRIEELHRTLLVVGGGLAPSKSLRLKAS
jgi:hypothetical protein